MLAQNGVPALGQAEGVLQLGAAGQQLGDAASQVQRLGAKPRDRRRTRSVPSKVRTTESSARM